MFIESILVMFNAQSESEQQIHFLVPSWVPHNNEHQSMSAVLYNISGCLTFSFGTFSASKLSYTSLVHSACGEGSENSCGFANPCEAFLSRSGTCSGILWKYLQNVYFLIANSELHGIWVVIRISHYLHKAIFSSGLFKFSLNRATKCFEDWVIRWPCYSGRRCLECRILLTHSTCRLVHCRNKHIAGRSRPLPIKIKN